MKSDHFNEMRASDHSSQKNVAHQSPLIPLGGPRAVIGRPPTPHGPACLMMYSHDGVGLGHMRRNANIASHFARSLPEASTLMLGGASPGLFFQVPAGVDFLKLPSVVKVGTNRWQPRTLRVASRKVHDLRSHLIQTAAEHFAPDLFIVDHVPAGVWGELVPTLKMLRRLPNPPKIMLGLRDILDTPEVVREVWRRDGVYDLIDRYYDGIFIYGSEAVYDTANRYGLHRPGKVHYCGYVCADEVYQSRDRVRAAHNLRARELVLVTAGGGSDAHRMMQTCVQALRTAGRSRDLEAILVTGPLMDDQQRRHLEVLAQGHPVQVIGSVVDLMSLLNAADLVVTMGGYNTLLEAIRLQKKVLVIPRSGPSAEQRIRATLFAKMGFVRMLEQDDLSSATLAGIIGETLADRSGPPAPLRFDGAKMVVEHMQRELASPQAATPSNRGGGFIRWAL